MANLARNKGRLAGRPAFRPLLFDRLSEDAAVATGQARFFDDREALVASIRRELVLLLNTRRANPDLLDPATATTLDYGIPNFSFRGPSDPLDLGRLAQRIANAVVIFEPRLIGPQVTAAPDPFHPNRALLAIAGSIRVGAALERVSFPLALDEQTVVSDLSGPL
jgi:type VI secretion system lysozyme-like protein